MAFKCERFFVGPFTDTYPIMVFLSDLALLAPSLVARGGDPIIQVSRFSRHVAFGYESEEHVGILSGGGWYPGGSDPVYSPQEFLDMLRFNEE